MMMKRDVGKGEVLAVGPSGVGLLERSATQLVNSGVACLEMTYRDYIKRQNKHFRQYTSYFGAVDLWDDGCEAI
jgi:hypothetical protein